MAGTTNGLSFSVNLDSPIAVYVQIENQVQFAIASGRLKPGDTLPSVREMSSILNVNPNTVTKAYRDLEHLGATEGRNGSGVFVTAAGPSVAKAIRLAETLAMCRTAWEQALRAGHDPVVLREVLLGSGVVGQVVQSGQWERSKA